MTGIHPRVGVLLAVLFGCVCWWVAALVGDVLLGCCIIGVHVGVLVCRCPY